MRRSPLVLAAATVLLLAGCAPAAETAETSAPSASPVALDCAEPGSASDAITVTGDFGAEPTPTFEAPLTAETTEATDAIVGDGEAVEDGSTVNVAYVVYNATSGEKLEAVGYDGQTQAITVDAAQGIIPGIYKSLACSSVGSRVVSVIPPADAFGDAGQDSLGIGADDSLVFVVDLLSITPSRADGVDQEPEDGFPTVALDEDGAPTITIPDEDAPGEFRESVLKKGDGPTVAEGDTVTVQYQGVVWDTGTVFDQSWGRGPTSFSTAGVVPGFAQGLIGQTVGSQVIIVIPPDLGYGEAGNEAAGIGGDDTIVFVVDILSTQSAPAAG